MNAVIYARYSSDNQREESIEGQVRECRAFAEKNDITIVDIYIDRAISAKTDNRPDFQKMIQDSAKHIFETVIVWKLDRFSRDRYDSAYYKHLLGKNGVKVISATENISSGPEGIILETLLEGMAAYYIAELSEKVLRGMTENALKCQFNGGTLTFGFLIDENKHYQLDPNTAPAVLKAFQMYAEGYSLQRIVDDFNEKGITNTVGNPFNVNSISRMLRNRRYIGEYIYNDIVIPDGVPAIVSKKLFDVVQERAKANKKTAAKHKAIDEYLLTTKLFCGKCKSLMFGESGKSHTGDVYRYYKCSSAKKKKGCDKKAVRKEWIEDIVIKNIKEVLFDDALLDSIADSAVKLLGEEDPLLPMIRKESEDIEKRIDNLIGAIEQGIVTDSTKKRLDELEERKKLLSVELAKLEAKKPYLNKEEILKTLKSFRNISTETLEGRRKLVNSFVNSIYLFDDKIVITFNYKKATRNIHFEDLKAETGSSDILSPGAPQKKESLMRFLFLCFPQSSNLFHRGCNASLPRVSAARGC